MGFLKLLFKQTVDGFYSFPSFDTLLMWILFIQQHSQTGSAQYLMLKFQ